MTFACGLTGAVAGHHYEQPGSLAGVLEVGGARVPIAGRGMRDHSWGVRDWQAVPYWRWFGIVVDPDNFLMLNNVGIADGGETAGGLVMRDGVASEVAGCETESELDPELGCQRRFVARATDALGREAVLEGEAISVAPLRQRRDGRLTWSTRGSPGCAGTATRAAGSASTCSRARRTERRACGGGAQRMCARRR